MRFAILSDIHGNLPALQAVFNDLAKQGFDQLIVAGDYIGGPQPVETINLLFEYDPIMISGNSDTNLMKLRNGEAPKEWYDSHQFSLLRWANNHVDDRTMEILQSLPEQQSIICSAADSIRVVHGSPRDQYESIFPVSAPDTLDAAFAQIEENILICGHTHVPWMIKRSNRIGLNPGAVGGPLNGQAGANFAILEKRIGGWDVDFRSVSYDINLIREAFKDSGLLLDGGALARAFLRSIETGTDVAMHFLRHAYDLAENAGYEKVKVVPDGIWEEAVKSYDWESIIAPCVP